MVYKGFFFSCSYVKIWWSEKDNKVSSGLAELRGKPASPKTKLKETQRWTGVMNWSVSEMNPGSTRALRLNIGTTAQIMPQHQAARLLNVKISTQICFRSLSVDVLDIRVFTGLDTFCNADFNQLCIFIKSRSDLVYICVKSWSDLEYN